MIEAAAEANEKLMENISAAKKLTVDEIKTGLARAAT